MAENDKNNQFLIIFLKMFYFIYLILFKDKLKKGFGHHSRQRRMLFLKNGAFPTSFPLLSSFQYTVDSKQMFNI